MVDSGETHKDIADHFEVSPAILRQWRKQEHLYLSAKNGKWRETFQGKTWEDMPGGDYVTQRCNFSLFRRGWLVYNSTGKLVPLRQANVKSKGGRRANPSSKSKPKSESRLEPNEADLFIFAETEDPSASA